MSASLSHPLSFDDAAKALQLDMLDYLFVQHPGEQCRRMTERIKLTAKLLARCTGLQQSKALDAVAQAVRFRHWHELSAHLARGEDAQSQALTRAWLDALSAAVVLMVMVEDDGFRFITLREEPLENPLNRILKRMLDLAVAVPVVAAATAAAVAVRAAAVTN